MRIFLLLGIVLFFGVEAFTLAFNGFLFRPDKVIQVRFEEVPPVMKFAGDIGVYYRGYKVGKATCKRLSQDQKYILFCLDINYKNLKLPSNTEIILKTQDIFGDRYFDLVYPKSPSGEFLADGDMVEGTAVYERLDKYLVEQLEEGEMGKLISNLNYLTGGARAVFEGDKKELKNLSGEISGSVDDISYVIKEIKTLLADPAVKKDVKTALAYMPKALKNANELLASEELKTTLKKTPELLDNTVANLETLSSGLPEVNANLNEVNQILPCIDSRLITTNSLLYTTNGQLGCLNPKIPVIPQDLIWQADRTLRRYDCIGEALSETMSKNCLFFRFLFGRPGEPFKECVCE